MSLRLAWPTGASCRQTATSDTITAVLEVLTHDAANFGESAATSRRVLGVA